MLDTQTIEALAAKAKDIRISTIREIAHLGNGHIGGAMSIVEVLTYLYFKEMNIDPSNPKMEGRDRFVCSKGHAGPSRNPYIAELEVCGCIFYGAKVIPHFVYTCRC